MATELLTTDMSHMASGTKHYCINEQYYAIEASIDAIPREAISYVEEVLTAIGTELEKTTQLVRPTVAFQCDELGQVLDMTPDFEFPPGTTHAEAALQIEGAV